MLTLAIDIGGSSIKMMVIDENSSPKTNKTQIPTPSPATPQAILKIIAVMLNNHGGFDRVSVGFPGVAQRGIVKTAPNLDPSWRETNLQADIERLTKTPVVVANDADVQGLGVISGKGVELVLTLGTGMGSSLFINGILVPNLELAHHPFQSGETYEDRLGMKALNDGGELQWNHDLEHAIDVLERTFNFDILYLGGGNASRVRMKPLANVRVVNNIAGLYGGIKLWQNF